MRHSSTSHNLKFTIDQGDILSVDCSHENLDNFDCVFNVGGNFLRIGFKFSYRQNYLFEIVYLDILPEPKLTIKFDNVNNYCLGSNDVSLKSVIGPLKRDWSPTWGRPTLLSFTVIDCLESRGKAHFMIGIDVEPELHFSSKLDLIKQSMSVYLNDSTRLHNPQLTILFDKGNSYCLGKNDASLESWISLDWFRHSNRRNIPTLSFTIIDCLGTIQLLRKHVWACFGPRTTDTQRETSLHCTAENSIPIPNF